MAKIPFEKIRVVGLKKHYKLLMQELHRLGVIEIIENENLIKASSQELDAHFGVFDAARVEFAVRFLSRYQEGSSKLDALLSGGKVVLTENEAKTRLNAFEKKSEDIIKRCELVEEGMVRARNTRDKMEALQKEMLPYEEVDIEIGASYKNEKVKTFFLQGESKQLQHFVRELSAKSNLVDIKVLLKTKTTALVRLVCETSVVDTCNEIAQDFGFTPFEWTNDVSSFVGETPRVVVREAKKRMAEIEKELADFEKEAKELSQHVNDLKILHEFTVWRSGKNNTQQSMYTSDRIFVFDGWMPKKEFKKLQTWIDRIFVGEVSLDTLEITDEDDAPILLENNGFASPFEGITKMYGTPGKKDLDPTSVLAPFFVVFFGLCLSDVGYGSLVTFAMAMLLIFGKYDKATKQSFRFMLYCGISTIIGGIFLGGYFGLTPDQVPSFMTTTSGTGEAAKLVFKGQVLNPMEGSGPMIFLGLAMLLGIIQILFGVFLDIVRQWKLGDKAGALMDPGAWFFFLSSLMLFALSSAMPLAWLPVSVTKVLVIAGAALIVLTQGRSQKNWLLKPIFGVLGLYNITAYLSDLLSYSRIMALGLATGVIGMAMNLTATVMGGLIPNAFFGAIVTVFILLFGHSLNFFLSLLGAFVHSGRLQFIEFFGKFYEGDGRAFKPFVRKKKHLFFTSSS